MYVLATGLIKLSLLLTVATSAAANSAHSLVDPLLGLLKTNVLFRDLPQLLHLIVLNKSNLDFKLGLQANVLALFVFGSSLEAIHMAREVLALGVGVGREV